jgi:hypothetical protein
VSPFLSSTLDGREWSASRPDRFTPGESSGYPMDRTLFGPQSRSGRCEVQKHLLLLLGIEHRPARRYTD